MNDFDIKLQAAKDIAHSGPSFIKNMRPEDIHRMVKFLVDEIDRYDFDLDCARADVKNSRWLLDQAKNENNVLIAKKI